MQSFKGPDITLIMLNAKRRNQSGPMHVRSVYKYESFIEFVYAIQIRTREILWQL